MNCRGNAGGIIQELSGDTVVDRQNPVITGDEVIAAKENGKFLTGT